VLVCGVVVIVESLSKWMIVINFSPGAGLFPLYAKQSNGFALRGFLNDPVS
jgi:hypothetical protein